MSCLKFTIEREGGGFVSRFSRAIEPLKASFSLVCDFGDYGYLYTVDGLMFQTSDGQDLLVKTI